MKNVDISAVFYKELKQPKSESKPAAQEVLILPIRNWNRRFASVGFRVFEFWSYLWGIETTPSKPCIKRRFGVLILPIRNWNNREVVFYNMVSWVLILPIRNWNYSARRLQSDEAAVLILPIRNWNVDRQCENQDGIHVSIFPMRNRDEPLQPEYCKSKPDRRLDKK